MANGNCPCPPKYTAPAMDAAASDNTATTADAGGFAEVPIRFILSKGVNDGTP